MSPHELALLISIPCVALVGLALFLRYVPRRQQSQVARPQEQIETARLDTAIADTAIQALSSRLAGVEGRIGGLVAILEAIPVLQSRLAAMETHMPALQEAYEKYADQIGRADKRMTERARKNARDQQGDEGISAGDAAAALTGVAVAGAPLQMTPTVTPNNNQTRPGVLGGGGRSR